MTPEKAFEHYHQLVQLGGAVLCLPMTDAAKDQIVGAISEMAVHFGGIAGIPTEARTPDAPDGA